MAPRTVVEFLRLGQSGPLPQIYEVRDVVLLQKMPTTLQQGHAGIM
jgi:hypothetical protein